MTKQERKDIAYTLYMSRDMTQKAIGEMVGVSEKTMSQWANEGEWDKLKQAHTVTRDRIAAKILGDLEELVNARNSGEEERSAKSTDDVVKLTKALSYLQNDRLMLPHTIQAFKMLNAFCSAFSADMTKDFILEMFEKQAIVPTLYKMQDLFIKENSKKMMY